MKIIVKSLFKNNRLTKIANGTNIFKVMQSKLNEDPTIKEFTLDMQGILFVGKIVFYEIKTNMQTSFDGDFVVKLENSVVPINKTFNAVFAQ